MRIGNFLPLNHRSRKKLHGLLSDVRALRGQARWELMRRRLGRMVGTRGDDLLVAGTLRDVLFVCHGNIMRSAIAAELFREELRRNDVSGVSVHSAGLAATTGSPADPRARQIAHSFGISLEQHRATRVTRELAARANLILVMDWRNEAEMVAQFPEHSEKVIMLGALAPTDFDDWPSIRDPYTLDDTEAALCFGRIRLAIAALARRACTSGLHSKRRDSVS